MKTIDYDLTHYVVIDDYNIKRYYKNGVLDRDDGPAIEYTNGSKEWYKDGKLHRENGPAIECDISTCWLINGEFHREDGPAIIYIDNRQKWFYKGHEIKCCSQEEFDKILNMSVKEYLTLFPKNDNEEYYD